MILFLSCKQQTNEVSQNPSTYQDKSEKALLNQNETKGDSPKYKGKGVIQLTWKDTYKKYFKYIGKEEFLSTPEKVAENLKYTFDSVGWYWIKGSAWGDINPKADNDDLIAVSIGINGGLNGYAHRKKNLKSILEKMKVILGSLVFLTILDMVIMEQEKALMSILGI